MGNDLRSYLDSDSLYVAYGAALALGDRRSDDLRAAVYSDARVRGMIDELMQWPGPSLNSHRSARQFFHKLAFLADTGVRVDHPVMAAVIGRVLEHRDAHGIPLLPMTISAAYGGSGTEAWAWTLCDAPTVLYSLITMGYRDDGIDSAVAWLAGRRQGDGPSDAWGCIVSEQLGSWRGPGRKTDLCPYATLVMTKLLLAHDPERWARLIDSAAFRLLALWRNSRTEHPYIFYMGTDFRKLKLPFIWYDILHVIDVLSRVPAARSDPAFAEMLELVRIKRSPDGSLVPESVYQEWKDWDFGQKKTPSAWMGLRVAMIEARIGH